MLSICVLFADVKKNYFLILLICFLFKGVIDIILFVLFIVSTLKCMSNFGKGLKPVMLRNKLRLNEISKDSPDLKDISFNQSEL